MTAYFDQVATDLREARTIADGFERITRFHEIEKKLVFDCTVASQLPGFPVELRLPLHHAVLRHGVSTLPRTAEPADFETDDEHEQRLHMLNSDLHSVFHEVAHQCFPRLTDNPLRGVNDLYDSGEEERCLLVEEQKYGPVRKQAAKLGLVRIVKEQLPTWYLPTPNGGAPVVGFDVNEDGPKRWWFDPTRSGQIGPTTPKFSEEGAALQAALRLLGPADW